MSCPVFARHGCARCADCLTNPALMHGFVGQQVCPEGYTRENPPFGLGDLIEKLAKIVTFGRKTKCHDKDGRLKPLSPCGQMKTKANRVVIS